MGGGPQLPEPHPLLPGLATAGGWTTGVQQALPWLCAPTPASDGAVLSVTVLVALLLLLSEFFVEATTI